MVLVDILSAPINTSEVHMAWVSAVIAGVGLISGIWQSARASRLARQNKMPEYTPDANILKNQALAERRALTGLPSEQYQLARDNINTSTAGALRSAERSGRPGSVASILGQSTRAFSELDARNAEARQRNERTLMGANEAVAAENRTAFDWNERQVYLQNMQRIQSLRQAGMSNAVGGLSLFAQSAMTPGTVENSWFQGTGAPDSTGMQAARTAAKAGFYNSPRPTLTNMTSPLGARQPYSRPTLVQW
jgi:hypothetical protein